MRLDVKEAGADAIFLNRQKCSFETHTSVSYEVFQVEKKKPMKRHIIYTFSYFYLYSPEIGRGGFGKAMSPSSQV